MSLAKDTPYFPTPSDYEDDIYLWALEQAQLLRLGRFSEVDLPNVIAEIESLGSDIRLNLEFCYRDLIMALLAWQISAECQTSELRKTILDARVGILEYEKDSKSLRADAQRLVRHVYPDAVDLTMIMTGFSRERFPFACPYPVSFLRNFDALPEPTAD